MDRIPIYEARIEGQDTGMIKISLVDKPAVESLFQKFSAEKVQQCYRVEDEERRIVRGVVMRADFPIYRRDDRIGEYYIVYHADTIRQMAEKYLAESRQNAVNLMHEDGTDVEGVQMVQWFIKDSAAGIAPEGFDGIADGSLFAEFHVVNDEVWQAIKDGTYKGFSLEGVFELQPETVAPAMSAQKNNKHQFIMGKLTKIKEALARILAEFGSVSTDKGALMWDGDDDLREGREVYIAKDDGREPAPDGDYKTEDGKIIRVSGGRVEEITDDAAEVAASAQEPHSEQLTAAQQIAQAFAMSYNDKMAAIWDAISAKIGTRDFWLEEAGDDFAVTSSWGDDYKASYMRYAVTWNGDTPEIGDGTAVRLAFIPKDMEVTFEAVLAQRDENADALKTAQAELQQVRAELEALKAQPLGKPAHEEVVAGSQVEKTGNKGLDRLAEIMSAR